MRRLVFIVSYDGTDFCGWQKQKQHAFGPKKPSIQETLERAFSQLLGHPVTIFASGRTDAGVHALAQVIHLDTSNPLSPKNWSWALHPFLPPTIIVKQAYLAPGEFHATLSARAKTYRYQIWNAPTPSCFLTRYSWWIRKPLDLEALKELSQPLIGHHDFRSFQTQGTPVAHTRRVIYSIRWLSRGPHRVLVEITGSGFLKQMVRNIVGTLLGTYFKGLGPDHIEQVLKACDRQRAGMTAPPQGLFLKRVYYPKDLDNQLSPF